MADHKLSEQEVAAGLQEIAGWELRAGKLHRELKFSNFIEAFGFMTKAAILSERKNHHPEWSNVYNRVVIDLTTHEFGGISNRDLAWAKDINQLLEHPHGAR